MLGDVHPEIARPLEMRESVSRRLNFVVARQRCAHENTPQPFAVDSYEAC